MIITKTPLRISLLGGGSDFLEHYESHPAAVLSVAINKYIYVIINGRSQHPDQITINYGNTYEIGQLDDLNHDLIRETIRETGQDNMIGKEIATIADISGKGSGLGSSSSLTVGLLNAISWPKFKGDRIGHGGEFDHKKWLTFTANEIEIDRLNRPQGIQDAYPAAYGGLRFYEFYEWGSDISARVNNTTVNKLFTWIMLFSTGTMRQSKEILTEQHQKTADNSFKLSQLANFADKGHKMIIDEKFMELGKLIAKSWQLKKRLSTAIATPEIDEMYTRALKAGAIGGKICGAGGGGFMLLIVPPDQQTAVNRELSEYQQMEVKPEQRGSHVIYTDK